MIKNIFCSHCYSIIIKISKKAFKIINIKYIIVICLSKNMRTHQLKNKVEERKWIIDLILIILKAFFEVYMMIE